MRERQGVSAFTGSEAGLDLAANAVVSSSWNGSTTLPPDLTVVQSGTGPSNDPRSTAARSSGPRRMSPALAGSPGNVEAGVKDGLSNGKVTRLLQGTMEPSVSTQHPPAVDDLWLRRS